MDKFREKLPKDTLKKHAKDVNKTLVASDYKHNRVEDPTTISEKQAKKVKIYVKDFLDKAVMKHREHEKHKVNREAKHGSDKAESSTAGKAVASVETPGALNEDEDIVMSDVEDISTSSPIKRKRDEDGSTMDTSLTPDEKPSMKRLREEDAEETSPPPPPPPPPDAGMSDGLSLTSPLIDGSRNDLQVEFSREQEEANRLADEAEQDRVRQEEALQRENEEAMREFELEQTGHQTTAINGSTSASAEIADAAKHSGLEQRSKQAIPGQ